MADVNVEAADAKREEQIEQSEMAARHRPDERAPNDASGPAGSGGGDIHAAGSTGGGTAIGGLAGTNLGDGSIENADIDAAAGSGKFDSDLDADQEPAYSGISGGAVGGTPAGKRASGGRTAHGIAPGGVHRGDSTVGGNPQQSGD
jgi:hypothetical protein